MLKLGITTDIHHSRSNTGTRMSLDAMRLLRGAIARFNDAQVDLVVDLGDMIQQIDSTQDLQLAHELYVAFERLGVDHEHVPGNHDVVTINIAAWESVFGPRSFTSRSFDLSGYHLVFFCAIRYTGPYTFTPQELAWLQADLASTALPTIIFTHVPLNAGSLSGNGYFPTGGNGEWTNAAEALQIVKNSTAVLVLQGHTHWNAHHVENDVHFVTIPSMTECRRTPSTAPGTYAIVEINEDDITIDIRGLDRMQYKLRRREGASVWL
jgi:predicted phosphodiesterase